MKLPGVLVFAFVFTLFLFTYGVEGGKNREKKDRDRRRQERKERRREERKGNKMAMIDENPSIISDLPTFPVPTMPPIATNDDFGDPALQETKHPRRHHHKSRGKDRREKAKKNKEDRQRRKETGTEQVSEPQIVSFSDMVVVQDEDPTDPAPAPEPTSKEGRMTEELPADNSIPATSDTNVIATTQVEMTNPITTAQKTEEPTPTPTILQTTESSRRRDREGRKDKKDKKNKDKKKDKNKKKDREEDEATQGNEIEPTEFEFSPTIQPEPQTTTITTTTATATAVTATSRNDRQKDRQGRRQERKEKRDKKKNNKTTTPTPAAFEEDIMADVVINDIMLTPETQTEITEKSGFKTGKLTNPDRQSNTEGPEVESKKKHSRTGERRDRDRSDSRGKKEKDQKRLLAPTDSFSESSTLDECKSDRECDQGSCCEVHEGSKICRDYNHQEGQKCQDMCACHSGLICQAPEPSRNSQRKQRFRPSRCRVPGVNGMGGDFVGIVQDALEDVMDTMSRPRRGRNE